MDAGRGLRVHDHDELGIGHLREHLLDRVGFDYSPPLRLHLVNPGTLSLGAVGEACAKRAVHADDDLVAIFNQVGRDHLHSRGAGAGSRKGHLVLGSEDGALQTLEVLHHFHEIGIEVSDHGRHHRLHHARMNVRGPRSQQDARGRP